MDAWLSNLLSNKTSKTRNARLRLRTQPYESTVASQPPIKGARPVTSNRPCRFENTAQGPEADAPDVPRWRNSNASSPLTTPPRSTQQVQFESYDRTRSGFSAGAAYRYAHDPTLSRHNSARSIRSMGAFPSTSHRSHKKSTHVDILEASSQIKALREAHTQRILATGERDFGEDVADRNIAQFGGLELEPAPNNYYGAALASDSEDDALEDLNEIVEPNGRNELDIWGRSTYVGVFDIGAGDDTAQPDLRTYGSASEIYADHNPINCTPPPSVNTHARRESYNSDNYANSLRDRGESRKDSSPSTDATSTIIASGHSNTITSSNGHFTSGGMIKFGTMDEPLQGASGRSQPLLESQDTLRESPFQAHPFYAPLMVSNTQDDQERQSEEHDPVPILTSRLSKYSILTTPPMSPMSPMSPTTGSPATSIPRASSEKEPPTASLSDKRYSRSVSASYSLFPPQESGRNKKAGGKSPTIPSKINDATVRPNDSKRARCELEGRIKAPPFEGAADLTNKTDAEVPKTQLPAIAYEGIIPKAGHIKERITHEIGDHDISQRIQPLGDVAALLTKHCMPAPNSNELIEAPESPTPSSRTQWAIHSIKNVVNSASVSSRLNVKTAAKHPEHLRGGDPIILDRQGAVTDAGVTEEETEWGHPPQLKSSGREPEPIIPLLITHHNDDSSEDYHDGASSHCTPSDQASTNADGEEELLFRDSELAFDGRLPGLKDFNPAVAGRFPVSRNARLETALALYTTHAAGRDEGGEGLAEATKALRRRQAEVSRKMGMLSVAEAD